MSLADKLKKNSTVNETSLLDESKFFQEELIQTPIPALNIALSGSIDGGFGRGVTMFAGQSKHFKTLFCLILARSFLKKNPDGMILFYDSEFGSPPAYFKSVGIDLKRVIHTPVANIESLKFDIVSQLENLKRGDKVMIIIDSVGNLASLKEVEDAKDQKSVADLTRARALKSLFRIITPMLTMKDIPLAVVNHTYKEIGLFPKDVVGGGTGGYYSADNIFIIGRRQEKKSHEKEIRGYHFIINVEKSRYTQEKSQIPVTVLHGSGIDKWSGLIEIAEESGHIIKTKRGNQTAWQPADAVGDDEKKYVLTETQNTEFWKPILTDESFQQFVKDKFQNEENDLLDEEDEESDIAEAYGDGDQE